MPVDAVRDVRHVLPTGSDRAPLAFGPRGLEDPEGLGARPLERPPSVRRRSAGPPVLKVITEAERSHGGVPPRHGAPPGPGPGAGAHGGDRGAPPWQRDGARTQGSHRHHNGSQGCHRSRVEAPRWAEQAEHDLGGEAARA
eukprot:2253617-Lingulodinium_polyedra.AAC.1